MPRRHHLDDQVATLKYPHLEQLAYYDGYGGKSKTLTTSLGGTYVMNAAYEPDLQPDWLQLGTGLTTDHTYDGQSTLVKRSDGTNSTVYVDNLYEVRGSTVTKYYWFNGERAAMRQGGTLSYMLSDHLGSTSAVLDSNGYLVKSERYFPFGKPRQGGVGQGAGAQTDKQFTGQQREGDLYFMKSRFYDPFIGRFLQPDSIVPDYANPQSLNRYSYVLNNPLRYTDPTGMCGFSSWGDAGDCFTGPADDVGTFFTSTLPNVGATSAGSAWSRSRWGASRSQDAFRWSWSGVTQGATDASSAVGSAARAVAPVAGDYLEDKGRDVANVGVRWAAVTAITGNPFAYPLLYPQDLLALGISFGSVGDRRSGSFGFALYENCRGLCQLGPNVPYTPGFLAFAPGRVSSETFTHENQHGIQSLIMGPAYLPVTQAFFASCGYADPCMHERSPLEVDANRASRSGLHFPGFLLP